MIFRKKPNTINILDVGSGAGILSIFAARTCCTKNKPQFNLKTKIERCQGGRDETCRCCS